MDKLKGKRIMVWTFMGNSRMYEALRDYGDRIDTIGLFSLKWMPREQLRKAVFLSAIC